MLEEYLVQYCSPTLAAMKTGSLFCYRLIQEKKPVFGRRNECAGVGEDEEKNIARRKESAERSVADRIRESVRNSIRDWNRKLAPKGISLVVLREDASSVLIYVYRKMLLERDLRKSGVFRLLLRYGYTSTQADYAISRLSIRLREAGLRGAGEFPHEIGIFLGYPLADVLGFIEHGGRECKYTGCWKVYGSERGALRSFARFERCRAAYLRLWQEGSSVARLAVSCGGA